jgi:hypothetical protein
MSELYLRALSLIYLFALCAVLLNALVKWENVLRRYGPRRKWIPKLAMVLSLLLLGAVVVLNVRYLVNYVTFSTSSDEGNYISIMDHGDRGAGGPISGPGFRLLMLFIHDNTPLSMTDTVAGFAALVTFCFPALLLLGYDRYFAKLPGSGKAVLLLMTTSYFLWPAIEGRPQQAGMLLLFASVLLFWSSLKDKRFLVGFLAVFLISFVYHLLTFMLVAATVFIIWWWEYVNERAGLKDALGPGAVVLVCLLSLVPGLLYEHMVGGIIWTLERSVLSPLATPWLIVLTGLAPFSVLVLSAILLRKRGVVPRVVRSVRRHSVAVMLLIGASIVAGIVVQYWLNEDIYSFKYRNNALIFLLFQLGNITFGMAFILGMHDRLASGEGPDVFLTASVALMLVGAAILVPSILLPDGFNNWFTRVINYWTLLAAPVAVLSLERVPKRFYKPLVLAVSALFILSLININKDTFFLNVP